MDRADAPTVACRCEEVTVAEVEAALTAGAATVNDVKRRTRVGMGLCQGIYCIPQVAALLAEARGEAPAAVAPMTARPPVRPLPLEVLAGDEGLAPAL